MNQFTKENYIAHPQGLYSIVLLTDDINMYRCLLLCLLRLIVDVYKTNDHTHGY